MNVIWAILDKIQGFMKAVASICLMGMCLMTCSDVFLRSTINKPIFGSEEIVSIFAVLAIGLALPYSHTKDSHVGVEILVRLLSRRMQNMIRFCTNILSFLLFLILSWKMFSYGQTIMKSGELSMNLELPMYYFVFVLSFCMLVISLCLLNDIFQFFKRGEDEV